MPKFKIIAQQTPFNHNAPIVIEVEQNCQTHAYIDSYKLLTAKGYNVKSKLGTSEEKELQVNRQFIEESLPTEFWTTNMVHIRNIQQLY